MATNPSIVSFHPCRDHHVKCMGVDAPFMTLPSSDGADCDGRYKIFVSLNEWPAEVVPDGPNLRQHNDRRILGSEIAQGIRKTIVETPEMFGNCNRGILVLANALRYVSKTETVEIELTDYLPKPSYCSYRETPIHGIANGGTTNMVIADVQKSLRAMDPVSAAALLNRGWVCIEVVTGMTDRKAVMDLVIGRHTMID